MLPCKGTARKSAILKYIPLKNISLELQDTVDLVTNFSLVHLFLNVCLQRPGQLSVWSLLDVLELNLISWAHTEILIGST